MWQGKTAVLTGASGGIGRALALWLAAAGAHLVLLGRDPERLEGMLAELEPVSGGVEMYRLDLEETGTIDDVCDLLYERHPDISLLVHSAGIILPGSVAASGIEGLDRHYLVNLRAPYLITRLLLPRIIRARGQIVFLNSGAGLRARRHRAQYSASKFALRALADSLREEVDEDGVRVLSVYPGPIAGPLQEELHRLEGKPYHSEDLLQPEQIAAQIGAAITSPTPGQVTDLVMRPANFAG